MTLLKKGTHSIVSFLWFTYRIVTSPWRRFPDFIILGVQKGGTSSLFSYLSQHPDIVPSKTKEVHFFDKNYYKGLYWYRSFFPLSFLNRKKITGEATPYYIFHPRVPERVQKDLFKAKLIILLRDPVYRAYSHYQMTREEGLEPLESFEEAIKEEENRLAGENRKIMSFSSYNSYNHLNFSYLSRGNYFDQIQNWLEYFPKEQLLFIKSECFYSNPKEELLKIYRFLGVKDIFPADFSQKNAGSYTPLKEETLKLLKTYYSAKNKKLIKLLGKEFTWD